MYQAPTAFVTQNLECIRCVTHIADLHQCSVRELTEWGKNGLFGSISSLADGFNMYEDLIE